MRKAPAAERLKVLKQFIDALARQRETHPATRVWCWAPGWRDNEGVPDISRMTRLTGFMH